MKCNLWPNGNVLPIQQPVKTATTATGHKAMPLKARGQSFRAEKENPVAKPLPFILLDNYGVTLRSESVDFLFKALSFEDDFDF